MILGQVGQALSPVDNFSLRFTVQPIAGAESLQRGICARGTKFHKFKGLTL
jgi:hypothetical protein